MTALQWVCAAGVGAAGYGWAEAQAFTTRHITVAGTAPLRILHLSDLHLTPGQTRKIQWLASLADTEPDLVVVTGDFLAHRMAVPAVAEALDGLLNRPGVFVFGSNDYNGPVFKNPFGYFNTNRVPTREGVVLPTEDLREMLTERGWHDLDNAEVRLTVGQSTIHARGTNDAHIELDDYTSVAGPFDTGAFALGVTHSPYSRITSAFTRDGAELILAGHTHGGQVCVPGYGALVTGVGTSPITPFRIACRPEATLLTITQRG